METLELRDRRYRLQQRINALDAEAKKQEIRDLEAEVSRLQAACPHEHREEEPEQGIWRCKDCDLQGSLDPGNSGAVQQISGD
ncbi:MAG: hypothetical protein ACE5JX_22095 [Acidobacteriota bacterium]